MRLLKSCLSGLMLVSSLCAIEDYYQERTKTVLEQAEELGCQKFMCGRIKIKPQALPEVRDWFNELNNRKGELLHAFSKEGVWIESVFLEHAMDGDYLIYYMRQDDLKQVYEVLDQLALPVRLFHVDHWKSCCEECNVLEPLFDLERLQNG